MVRRPLPTLLALLIGLAALLWGVVSLQRIFIQERDDARAALRAQRDALREYGRRALDQRLREQLDYARPLIQAAVADPLVSADGLYLREGTSQRLPRVVVYREGSGGGPSGLLETLRDPRAELPEADPDDPWSARLLLLREFQDAVKDGNRRRVENTFRAILTHRARFVVSSAKDIPYQLALLEFFQAESSPDHALMLALLRDGLEAADKNRLPGLQRQLLTKREKFAREDFEVLVEHLAKLSEAAQIRHDDFLAAAHREPTEPLAIPDSPAGPGLVMGGAWYVDPRGGAGVKGIAIDFEAVVGSIGAEMQDLGLLENDDRLSAGSLTSDLTPVGEVSFEVASPRWVSAEQAINHRYRIKSSLGVVLGGLALTIIGLVGLLVIRERRFLALKSGFVATVSHELRTPLAAVRLLAETLERRLGSNPDARDYPKRIIREIDRLNFLVENILSFNRLEKGRLEPKITDVRLEDVVSSMRDELELFSSRPVDLTTEGIDDIVLQADPDLMDLLFLNLGTNACKYNEQDPVRIRIDAEAGDRVVIRVHDNGIGIREGDRADIFTEFYRPESRVNGASGFGLGLAICKRIMAIHAGDIRVAESGPEGTTFELTFPRASPPT